MIIEVIDHAKIEYLSIFERILEMLNEGRRTNWPERDRGLVDVMFRSENSITKKLFPIPDSVPIIYISKIDMYNYHIEVRTSQGGSYSINNTFIAPIERLAHIFGRSVIDGTNYTPTRILWKFAPVKTKIKRMSDACRIDQSGTR